MFLCSFWMIFTCFCHMCCIARKHTHLEQEQPMQKNGERVGAMVRCGRGLEVKTGEGQGHRSFPHADFLIHYTSFAKILLKYLHLTKVRKPLSQPNNVCCWMSRQKVYLEIHCSFQGMRAMSESLATAEALRIPVCVGDSRQSSLEWRKAK